jgi:hypothetical protein
VTGRYGGAVLKAPRARLTAVAARLPRRHPHAVVHRFPHAGHLVTDGTGGELGSLIRDFLLPEPLRGQR